MDTAVLHTLTTAIRETIDAFLAEQNEQKGSNVHSITLKYCPESLDSESYCELQVSQTVMVILRGGYPDSFIPVDPGDEAVDLQPFDDAGGDEAPLEKQDFAEVSTSSLAREPIREATLEKMEAHISETESRARQGFPPLTEEARRQRQEAAEDLLTRRNLL